MRQERVHFADHEFYVSGTLYVPNKYVLNGEIPFYSQEISIPEMLIKCAVGIQIHPLLLSWPTFHF